jgi:hypothetical protein
MRSLLAAVTAATLFGGAAAHAEKRMFIIASNPDGYGIDRCLATGAMCGISVATAYCHSHEFAHALSFRKVDRDDITGAVPTSRESGCVGSTCADFVAIECGR